MIQQIRPVDFQNDLAIQRLGHDVNANVVESASATQRCSFMQAMMHVFRFFKLLLTKPKHAIENIVNVMQVKIQFVKNVQINNQGRNQESQGINHNHIIDNPQ